MKKASRKHRPWPIKRRQFFEHKAYANLYLLAGRPQSKRNKFLRPIKRS